MLPINLDLNLFSRSGGSPEAKFSSRARSRLYLVLDQVSVVDLGFNF